MRTEQELRERLASEIIAHQQFESKDSKAARACWERQRVLIWVLENTENDSEIPPQPTDPPHAVPKRENGSSDQIQVVGVDDDDPGDEE